MTSRPSKSSVALIYDVVLALTFPPRDLTSASTLPLYPTATLSEL
uniref:Uncharacterized protein n=1 Tax=Rhizophora mucronata TaxID=61149 RepID=A0A2P2IT93_RHIMU